MLSIPDREVRVGALAGDILLCSCVRHFTLTVPLSTQVYKWLPVNLMSIRGGGGGGDTVTLRWDSIPSRAPAWWATWLVCRLILTKDGMLSLYTARPSLSVISILHGYFQVFYFLLNIIQFYFSYFNSLPRLNSAHQFGKGSSGHDCGWLYWFWWKGYSITLWKRSSKKGKRWSKPFVLPNISVVIFLKSAHCYATHYLSPNRE